MALEGRSAATRPLILFASGDAGRASDPLAQYLLQVFTRQGIEFHCLDAKPGDENLLEGPMATRLRELAAQHNRAQRLILAGFSRGARRAAALGLELGATAWFGVGYPFHAARQPIDRERIQALYSSPLPALICQGTRDPHGNRAEVKGYVLPDRLGLCWVEGARHLFGARELDSPCFAQATQRLLEFVLEHG